MATTQSPIPRNPSIIPLNPISPSPERSRSNPLSKALSKRTINKAHAQSASIPSVGLEVVGVGIKVAARGRLDLRVLGFGLGVVEINFVEAIGSSAVDRVAFVEHEDAVGSGSGDGLACGQEHGGEGGEEESELHDGALYDKYQEISFYSTESDSKNPCLQPVFYDRRIFEHLMADKVTIGHMGLAYYETNFFDGNMLAKQFGQQTGTVFFYGHWYRMERDNGRTSPAYTVDGVTVECHSQFYAY
ncbi:hypothetical protein HDU97_005924 [Phlyctochytrium planicorne]|nr:hypothetical protein HDU97_005924 [Phlyctochytrium planicorne]